MPDKLTILEDRYLSRVDAGESGWYPQLICDSSMKLWRSILGQLNLVPGSVAEFGCGAGQLLSHLSDSGWETTGFDVSRTAISLANVRSPKSKLHVRDLGKALEPFWDNQFDLVLDGDCYQFQIGIARNVFLANVRNLLNSTGIFVLRSVVGAPRIGDWNHLDYDPGSRASLSGQVPMTYFAEPEELLMELRLAHLQCTHWQTCDCAFESKVMIAFCSKE